MSQGDPTSPAGETSLTELAELLRSLTAALKTQFGDPIVLHRDHFWHIPPDRRFDVYEQPSELDIGSLAADLERVRSEGDDWVVPTSLVWLGRVIEAAGYELEAQVGRRSSEPRD